MPEPMWEVRSSPYPSRQPPASSWGAVRELLHRHPRHPQPRITRVTGHGSRGIPLPPSRPISAAASARAAPGAAARSPGAEEAAAGWLFTVLPREFLTFPRSSFPCAAGPPGLRGAGAPPAGRTGNSAFPAWRGAPGWGV